MVRGAHALLRRASLTLIVPRRVEKYRPATLEDVVSHKDITTTSARPFPYLCVSDALAQTSPDARAVEKFIEKNRLPHLLLYGPPGTGKTSTIHAVARRIYGPNYRKQILEVRPVRPHTRASPSDACHKLNASDDRGIDVVREQIKQFAETRTLFARGYKLIVLDEADMMTTAAQAALRRVIEQYTRNVRFCIICNYVNKIVPAIQSRCTRFRFSPLPIAEVGRRVEYIAEAEGCVIFFYKLERY
jgi:replication factor C subunit 3/5